jgi:hypothetical protein
MPANESNPAKGQESSGKGRYIETAAQSVDDLAFEASLLNEDLEHGEATEVDLLRLHQRIVVTTMKLRDAATAAGVIDDEHVRHRTIDSTLKTFAYSSKMASDAILSERSRGER